MKRAPPNEGRPVGPTANLTLAPEQRQQDDDRQWNPDKPKQHASSKTHGKPFLGFLGLISFLKRQVPGKVPMYGDRLSFLTRVEGDTGASP
jgi:hypothetical protein